MRNFISVFAFTVALAVIPILATIGAITIIKQYNNNNRNAVDNTGEGGQVLTDTFQCTHVHESSFETPKFKTFEKRGMKLWIMEPDTLKRNPLILSDWKLTIDGNPRKKYRSGDFDQLTPEIQKLFWFKAD